MATISFYRHLVIDSDEAAANMLKAIDEADARGPVEYYDPTEDLRRGEEFAKKFFGKQKDL